MRYENEKCPVCNQAFKQDDEIVVCPACGTPHHKDCYQKMGKCINAHMHDSGYVWSAQTETVQDAQPEQTNEAEDFAVCPQCGYKNPKNRLLCQNCHAPLSTFMEDDIQREQETIYIDGQPVPGNETIGDNIPVKDAAVYLQRKKESYMKVFLTAKHQKKRPRFNWAAFLFSPYWFFYRKMYRPGFAFLGINVAFSLIFTNYAAIYYDNASTLLHALENTPDAAEEINRLFEALMQSMIPIYIYFGILLVLNLIAGFLANRLYLKRMSEDIGRIREISQDDRMYMNYLFAKGGTSLLSAVGGVFIYDLLVTMLTQIVQYL